jgi:spoIIIJ-associated protein
MKSVEKRGKSVEEAVSLALEELGKTEDEVDIEILEEAKQGLFGLLGQKGALVKVSEKASRADAAERFLAEVLSAMQLEGSFETTTEEGYIFINILGDDLGSLIGRRGQTLNSLQYLSNLAVTRHSAGQERIVLDVEGYRRRREETLKTLALRLADKVKRTGQPVMLEPMSAQERRVVHTALQDSQYVMTKSEGEDPYRKVVIIRK